MPYISKVASGDLKELSVFGSDYPTHDGTGMRDYIHVVDLARGHLAALKQLKVAEGMFTANLGTGKGYTVLGVVRAFKTATGRRVPYRLTARRHPEILPPVMPIPRLQKNAAWLAGATRH